MISKIEKRMPAMAAARGARKRSTVKFGFGGMLFSVALNVDVKLALLLI